MARSTRSCFNQPLDQPVSWIAPSQIRASRYTLPTTVCWNIPHQQCMLAGMELSAQQPAMFQIDGYWL